MQSNCFIYITLIGTFISSILFQGACTSDSSVKELKCPKGTQAYGGRPPLGNREYCGRTGPSDQPEAVTNHGLWRYWWPNGNRQHQGYYKDGQKQGKFTQWADSGQKITEGKYERDRKQGTWKRWNRQGKIQEKIQYVDGRIHGFRSLYDRDGVLETELVYEAGELMGRKDELD